MSEHKIGQYVADYSELTPEQIAAPIPAMDDLLHRSRIASEKREFPAPTRQLICKGKPL